MVICNIFDCVYRYIHSYAYMQWWQMSVKPLKNHKTPKSNQSKIFFAGLAWISRGFFSKGWGG